MSQCEKIIRYMKDFGSITTMQAFQDLGITRLSGRIYDLKALWIPDQDGNGRWAQQVRREGTLF